MHLYEYAREIRSRRLAERVADKLREHPGMMALVLDLQALKQRQAEATVKIPILFQTVPEWGRTWTAKMAPIDLDAIQKAVTAQMKQGLGAMQQELRALEQQANQLASATGYSFDDVMRVATTLADL